MGVPASRVDRVDRLLGTLDDVSHVLLMEYYVVSGPQPAHVATDEVLPRVGERIRWRFEVAGYVLGEVGHIYRRPAGIDDVDHHERVVVGKMDDDVVR